MGSFPISSASSSRKDYSAPAIKLDLGARNVPMIEENALKGDYLTSLSAIDEDGDEVIFTIVSGNTKNAFIIDKNDIILNNPYALDFRENPSFFLIVEGSDGTLVSSVEITVTVNDIPGFVTSLTDEVNTTRPKFYPNPLEGYFVYLNLPQHCLSPLFKYQSLHRGCGVGRTRPGRGI